MGGLFRVDPLRYESVVHNLILRKNLCFDDLKEFLMLATDSMRIQKLYLCIPSNDLQNGMVLVKIEKRVVILYDIVECHGKIAFYIDHAEDNISKYICEYNDEDVVDENDLDFDQNGEECDENDPDEDNDKSIPFFDHLFKGEEKYMS